MESNQFDRSARNELSGYESKMDTGKFWDQLEPKLPKNKNRNRFILWIRLAGIAAVACLCGYLYNANKQYSEQSIKMAAAKIDDNCNDLIIEHSNHISNVINKNSSNTSLGQSTIVIDDINLNRRKSETNNRMENNKNQINKSAGNLYQKNKPEVLHKNLPADKESTKLITYLNESKHETQSSKSLPLTGLHKEINESDQFLLTESNHAKNEVLAIRQANEEEFLSNNETPLLLKTELQSNETGQKEINSMETYLFPLKMLITLPDLSGKLILAKEIKPNKPGLFHLEFNALTGIGFYQKHLSASNKDVFTNYDKIRNLSESNLEEWLIGLNAGFCYKNFGILLGLERVIRNERFNYYSTQQQYYYGTTSIRVETKDSVSYISGNAWSGQISTRKVVHYNSIKQWNLPLGIQYRFDFNGINIGIALGTMCSLYNHINGEALDSTLQIQDWNQSSSLKYKSNLGLGWFADLSFNIPLTKGIKLNSGFRVQEFPTDYLSGPLSLHYKSYYLRSGLNIYL